MMRDPRTMPVRFSRLKYMAESPKKYLWACSNVDDNDELLLGRCTHMLVLGGDEFVVWGNDPSTGKAKRRAGKDWEAFRDRAKSAGQEVVTQKIWDKARWMADSVMGDELAMWHLKGTRELQIHWKNCGRDCSSRLDNWRVNSRIVSDLKTTRTAKPAAFKAMAKRYGYHAQLAWYLDAATWLAENYKGELGFPNRPLVPERGTIVAVEKTPPYDVVVFEPTTELLEQGRRMCRIWLEQLLACESAGQFPGYSQCLVPIEPDEDEPELTFGEETEEDDDAADR